MNSEEKKKPGPIAGPETVRTNVLVEPDLLDWAKRQPGGFSETVRRLLREAKGSTSEATTAQTPVSNAAMPTG